MNQNSNKESQIPEGNVEKAERSAKYRKSRNAVPAEKNRKPLIAAEFLVIVFLLILIIAGERQVHRTVFPSFSSINGISVSGLTAKEAEAKLTDAWNKESFTVQENGTNVKTISLSKLDLNYKIDSEVKDALHPSFTEGLKNAFFHSSRSWKINRKCSPEGTAFDNMIDSLPVIKNGQGTVKTEDAYVDLSNTYFRIVKEVYGDSINRDLFRKDLLHAISTGKNTFQYNPKTYYTQPKVTADSKTIKDRVAYCKKYLTQKITYIMPHGKVTLTPADLDKMKSVSKDGTVTIDQNAVKKYVDNDLSGKVSTVGMTRTRTAATGETYTVSGGDYGFTLNHTEEASSLAEDLKNGKNVTRYPKYNQKPNADGSYTDIGNTYVEICISRQHAWFVKDGQVVIDRDVVTGNVAKGHSTPLGVYYVKYKTTNATLTDNRTYESHVSYWMPFNGGIGMHDATYLSSYGGTRYLTNGSHGCINMPLELAATIYQSCYAGMPVIVRA